MVTPPVPWAAFPMLHNSFSKEIFPNIQSKPPPTQLEAIKCDVQKYKKDSQNEKVEVFFCTTHGATLFWGKH